MSRSLDDVRVRQHLKQVGSKENVIGKSTTLKRSDNFYLYNCGVVVLFGNRISLACETRRFLWFLCDESVKYDSARAIELQANSLF